MIGVPSIECGEAVSELTQSSITMRDQSV